MPPKHMGAKSVDGGDACLPHPGCGRAEAGGVFIIHRFLRQLGQAGGDALFHLRCGSPREGDHQKAIQGATGSHQRGDALCKHGGFAAACCRAHQKIALGFDGAALLSRPFHGSPPQRWRQKKPPDSGF